MGAKATAIRNRFDGMCVNTIVFIRPILAAIRAASHRENAARIWAKENISASSPSSRPKCVLNQKATRL